MTSKESTKVVVFAASVRPNRMNARVIRLVQKRLQVQGYATELVADPRELQLPILDKAISEYADAGAIPAPLKQINQQVQMADLLLFTTCEYNRCIPPGLSNLLDYLPHKTMAYKPAGVIAYTTGPDGGQIAASQLRLCLTELGCLVAPHSMLLYNVGDRVSEQGDPLGSAADRKAMFEELDLIIEQVVYLSNAIKIAVAQTPPPKVHPYV
ncbi:unnamed protein product [Echinostoma caproni]|uniref:FMN_red domain-containing protein n=1 Tax=Echinostoma caproni TaxID=27848 RepID=A0A183A836_9TREM|nr:unnamed protein product [Echinostoma caproni]